MYFAVPVNISGTVSQFNKTYPVALPYPPPPLEVVARPGGGALVELAFLSPITANLLEGSRQLSSAANNEQ